MTKGELVAELIGVWEESVQQMERGGFQAAADEIKTAISVLEKTYTIGELLPTAPDDSYDAKCD